MAGFLPSSNSIKKYPYSENTISTRGCESLYTGTRKAVSLRYFHYFLLKKTSVIKVFYNANKWPSYIHHLTYLYVYSH